MFLIAQSSPEASPFLWGEASPFLEVDLLDDYNHNIAVELKVRETTYVKKFGKSWIVTFRVVEVKSM